MFEHWSFYYFDELHKFYYHTEIKMFSLNFVHLMIFFQITILKCSIVWLNSVFYFNKTYFHLEISDTLCRFLKQNLLSRLVKKGWNHHRCTIYIVTEPNEKWVARKWPFAWRWCTCSFQATLENNNDVSFLHGH